MVKMLKKIINDAASIKERDPAAKNIYEVVFLYSGFHAVFFHRIAHFFYKKNAFFIARLISQLSRFLTLIEIHPGAKIGKGLFIDHGAGIVIGETTEVGDNCTIYHGVTLGGTGKDVGKRHPTIGDNVLVSAGAKVLGPIIVGNNARVGANAVVLREVEENTTVVGVPGKDIRKKDKVSIASIELDQIHISDPVVQELCKMLSRIEGIEKNLNKSYYKVDRDLDDEKGNYGVFRN